MTIQNTPPTIGIALLVAALFVIGAAAAAFLALIMVLQGQLLLAAAGWIFCAVCIGLSALTVVMAGAKDELPDDKP